jgi:hypothetical protein
VLVSADALQISNCAWAKTGAGSIGDAKIRWNAEKRDVDVWRFCFCEIGPIGSAQQGWNTGMRRGAFVGTLENRVGDLLKTRIENLIACDRLIFGAQVFKLLIVERRVALDRDRPRRSADCLFADKCICQAHSETDRAPILPRI